MKKSVNLLMLILMLSSACNIVTAQDKNAGDEKMTIAELLAKADQIFNSNQYIESRDFYQKTADLAAEKGDSSSSTEAYAMLARTYLRVDERDKGQKYLVKAVETASPDHPLGWSRYLGVRGRFEWHDKRVEKAMETFKEMYYYSSAHKLYDRAVDAAHMIAITGNLDEQVEWAKKGIKEAERGKVNGWLGPLWNNLGATYEDLEQYDSALEAYKKARDYHYQYGQERNKLIADWAVGHAYRLLKINYEAEKYLKPLIKKFDDLNDLEFLGWTYKELGLMEFNRENYRIAVKYLYYARDNLKQSGIEKWDSEGYEDLIKSLELAKMKSEKWIK